MEFSEQVLIIRTGRFREADLWVRFLCPTHGLLTAFAFGGCRSRRRFCGCFDLFNRALLRVKSTRGGQYLSIQEGTLLCGPDRLRRDWPRFGAAMNCLKFLEALGCGPEGATSTYRLAVDLLDLLERGDSVPAMLPVLFRLRLAAEQGYAPRMDRCTTCGNDLTRAPGAAFLVREGVVQCDACAPLPGPRVRVERRALDVLRFVQENPPLLWPDALFPAFEPTGGMPAGEHFSVAAYGVESETYEFGMDSSAPGRPSGADRRYGPNHKLSRPGMIPRPDSARTGFAGRTPHCPDSLPGPAGGRGHGHGVPDDCLCRPPEGDPAADALPQTGQVRGHDALSGPQALPQGAPQVSANVTRCPLWNGSSVFGSDPFGPVSDGEEQGRQQTASLHPAHRGQHVPPVAPAAGSGEPAPPAAPKTKGAADAAGNAAVRRQCTRAVDGFIQFHVGLAWDNGRFRRL